LTQDWDWRSALANGSRRTPLSWEPKPGDELAGTVADRGEIVNSFDPETRDVWIDIKVIEATIRGEPVTPGDWLRVVCSRARLREMVEKDNPRPGDLVAIRYHGLEAFERGVTRARYTTVVERPTSEADDW
jgi:hypothetical protein